MKLTDVKRKNNSLRKFHPLFFHNLRNCSFTSWMTVGAFRLRLFVLVIIPPEQYCTQLKGLCLCDIESDLLRSLSHLIPPLFFVFLRMSSKSGQICRCYGKQFLFCHDIMGFRMSVFTVQAWESYMKSAEDP